MYYKGSAVFEAVAENEAEVRRMAEDAGEDLTGMEIELTTENFSDFFGRPMDKKFQKDY